jgi:hypothetical protein
MWRLRVRVRLAEFPPGGKGGTERLHTRIGGMRMQIWAAEESHKEPGPQPDAFVAHSATHLDFDGDSTRKSLKRNYNYGKVPHIHQEIH